MKQGLLFFLALFAMNAFGGTLFIHAKKAGHNQDMRMTYVHVTEYGYNMAGDFILRLEDGNQVSLGKRSSWIYFKYTFVDDKEMLTP